MKKPTMIEDPQSSMLA